MAVENKSPVRSVRQFVWALWIINRYEALLAYNIGYFTMIFAGGYYVGIELSNLWLYGALFGAVLMMKSHASVADALHDYDADSQNVEKSYVAESVDIFGEENARTFMILEILVSLFLWGYLTHVTGDVLFLTAGVVSVFFGYTYSYPPRFKERNIFNHVVTSGVDVSCLLMPGFLLLTGEPATRFLPIAAVVFCYSLAFHIMHQAGDTYQDRQASISTFTTYVGLDAALAISSVLLLAAAAISVYLRYPLIALACIGYGFYLVALYYQTYVQPEKEQSLSVSRAFSVARCASILNFTLAADFFILALL
ncbi:prenyltransferase [Halobacteriales archaeon QS_1_68_20]|nr:MAG: prenyltransferase [Halobacteriales archaeon QS_1_68_20]